MKPFIWEFKGSVGIVEIIIVIIVHVEIIVVVIIILSSIVVVISGGTAQITIVIVSYGLLVPGGNANFNREDELLYP